MPDNMPKSALSDKPVDALQAAITASFSTVTINSVEDVASYLGKSHMGDRSAALYQRLKAILPEIPGSDFDTHSLRNLAGALCLRAALNNGRTHDAEIITVIAGALPASTKLKSLTDPVWIEAATIGRALIALDVYRTLDQRHIAVSAAAKHLKDNGFDLQLGNIGIDVASLAFRDVTEAIGESFARLGLFDVLANICRSARIANIYDFDQYLFGRRYSQDKTEPTIPFGFLFNLAVRAPDKTSTSPDPEKDWCESIILARDLVAALDIEPYNKFWMINQSPSRMGRLLEEVGLHDHLFSLRQWPVFVTPLLLQNFFGNSHDSKFTASLGWNTTDAVRLSSALAQAIRTDPSRLQRSDLLSTGLNSDILDRMLPSFVHSAEQVNKNYTSPLAARSADLMFRPLIEGAGNTFVAPSASIIGPAC